jgi:hypothetical protein
LTQSIYNTAWYTEITEVDYVAYDSRDLEKLEKICIFPLNEVADFNEDGLTGCSKTAVIVSKFDIPLIDRSVDVPFEGVIEIINILDSYHVFPLEGSGLNSAIEIQLSDKGICTGNYFLADDGVLNINRNLVT